VLQADIGQLLVTARRKGNRWYLGGLSAREPREVALPLSFLVKGEYVANLWRDASDTTSNPNHLETETRSVTATQTMKVKIASDGGFVAQISPR
jgi:alpha-glucosidase